MKLSWCAIKYKWDWSGIHYSPSVGNCGYLICKRCGKKKFWSE